LIPVHEDNHWTALMVDIPGRRLVFFNSAKGRNRGAVRAVLRRVQDEAQVCVVCACGWEGGSKAQSLAGINHKCNKTNRFSVG